MKVTVCLYSTLTKYSLTDDDEFTFDMEDSASLGVILEALNMPDTVQRVILVNGRHAKPHTILKEGDLVTLFPPMTGG